MGFWENARQAKDNEVTTNNRVTQRTIEKSEEEICDKILDDVKTQYVQYGKVAFSHVIWNKYVYISKEHDEKTVRSQLAQKAKNALIRSLKTMELDTNYIGSSRHATVSAWSDAATGWHISVDLKPTIPGLGLSARSAYVTVACHFTPPLT